MRYAVLAVVLVGLMAVALSGQYSNPRHRRHRSRSHAEQQMARFEEGIKLYYAENRNLPESLQDLTREDPRTGEKWMDSIPKDPWGGEYAYRVLVPPEFRLRSFGQDGQEGTSDDIPWPPAE
jgi:type II secretory pathway pseudopilin PulG